MFIRSHLVSIGGAGKSSILNSSRLRPGIRGEEAGGSPSPSNQAARVSLAEGPRDRREDHRRLIRVQGHGGIAALQRRPKPESHHRQVLARSRTPRAGLRGRRATRPNRLYGMAATRPCFARTAFSFSMSGGPPAFTMAAVSLKKPGPISAGVTTASAFASVWRRLLKP